MFGIYVKGSVRNVVIFMVTMILFFFEGGKDLCGLNVAVKSIKSDSLGAGVAS